ncbi:MAG: CoB--CoM heterodisulfide reductase iron-sulfur subunit A family protein [Desulfobacteraceae bacterium]|nr:MAG: CoB--CoM heterodisulfide reductase iron-sulfur subunit A family protein [Desulfobacteraceae bacterium]
MDKCIACGICSQKCPKKVDDEFNMGISKRKAAYIQYGQTVPLKYAIDPKTCLFTTKGKCRACEKFCPTGAINFDDKEEIQTFSVGSLILSPGYKPFDPAGIDFYGYGKIPDVVTGLEYERMLSPGGPFHGHLEKPSDHKEPKNIAWIQCVGSRSTNRCENGYCSSVCCMYAMKQALITAAHLPDGGRQTLFYMDIRSHGKEFELYYNYAKEHDIRFVRARPHTIEPGPGNTGVTMRYVTEDGRQLKEDFDMAVLSVGMEASADALDLSQKTGIELTAYNFAKTGSFTPVSSSRDGIFVSGCFKGPMNIPSSVAVASAASAEASKALISAKGTLTREKKYPAEKDLSGQPPRIGVFVCSCGSNIAGVVDVAAVVDYAKTLPYVVHAENNMFACSTDTQELLAKVIGEQNLNRIVIAACTPRTHEPLFQDTLKEAGLNGYLVEMANIRNHNSWVHQKQPEKATAKAMDQVRMAAAKVGLAFPIQELQVNVVQKALVIGGGVAGMNAALGLADQGYETMLLEKTDALGGNAWHLSTTAKNEKIRPMLEQLIQKVESHERIEILKNARLTSSTGTVGNFTSSIQIGNESREIQYGAAVLATGARESEPTEFMYGEDARIMTHLEFEKELAERKDRVQSAGSAVFIQCVGSRNTRRPYCSRVCCTHSVQNAITLKTLNPSMNVYVLYRDMRTYGTREDLYTEARRRGVVFIRYDLENPPLVAKTDGALTVKVTDPILGMPLELTTDYLILAAAIVPNETRELVELYKCAVNADGFLNEAHPKLRPVDMAVDGLFIAGLCTYPKPIDESISQAKAAVARANVILSQNVMQLDAIKSFVTDHCDGCALCLDVCPYRAITLTQHSDNGHTAKKISTDKALCKGCGLCAATCPKRGVMVHGFTTEQLRAQVYAALDLIG